MTDKPHITPREASVLRLTDGRPMSAIAQELGVSTRTVRQASDALRNKYDVAHRWQLTAFRKDAQ
jgi:DNA-binding NarL/FixJ family response regulator